VEPVGLVGPGWLGRSAIASKSNYRVIISWRMGSSGAGGLVGLVGPGGLSGSPTASKSNYRVIISWGLVSS
jgi:hypothetical protein